MAKKSKDKTNTNPYSTNDKIITRRGCRQCGRWAIFARDIYLDSGELCEEDTCINLIRIRSIEGEVS